MQKIGDFLKKYDKKVDKYVSREFQQYGYELAQELSDLKHKSLYIKLAKTEPRGFLEAARSFVKDANNVNNRSALFMWKLSEIKKSKKQNAKKLSDIQKT